MLMERQMEREEPVDQTCNLIGSQMRGVRGHIAQSPYKEDCFKGF
jgi:hypothetical protein